MVHTVIATITSLPGQRDKVVSLLDRIAQDSYENERDTTLSFQIELSADDADKVVVVERYVNREAFTEIHRQSPAVKEFVATSPQCVKSTILDHYTEPANGGFVSRT